MFAIAETQFFVLMEQAATPQALKPIYGHDYGLFSKQRAPDLVWFGPHYTFLSKLVIESGTKFFLECLHLNDRAHQEKF